VSPISREAFLTSQVFHVGYPKSGSKTIQTLLRASGVNFLGKPYLNAEAEYFVREDLSFGDLRQLPLERLRVMRRTLCSGSPVISDEILSGIGLAHSIAANSLLQILDNLSLLTSGDFIAFVILRRPAALIRSYFGQLVRMGAHLSFDQFCSLVLLRRHRWLFRGLDYGSLLRSDYYRSGRLRVALFEDLFQEREHLVGFMRGLGATTLPASLHELQTNPSVTDAVIDFIARYGRDNPAGWIHSQITRPSAQEYEWLERLPLAERELHMSLWQDERREGLETSQIQDALARDARARASSNPERRPPSAAHIALLGAIALANEGVPSAFPEIGFDRHRYFVPDA